MATKWIGRLAELPGAGRAGSRRSELDRAERAELAGAGRAGAPSWGGQERAAPASFAPLSQLEQFSQMESRSQSSRRSFDTNGSIGARLIAPYKRRKAESICTAAVDSFDVSLIADRRSLIRLEFPARLE